MKRYVCECCGASINLRSLKCDYCGTQYKNEDSGIFRVLHYQAPIDTYTSTVTVSNLDLETMGEKSGEIISNMLARNLTEAIKQNISISVRNNLPFNNQIFRGIIKVVKPIHDYNNIDEEYST